MPRADAAKKFCARVFLIIYTGVYYSCRDVTDFSIFNNMWDFYADLRRS